RGVGAGPLRRRGLAAPGPPAVHYVVADRAVLDLARLLARLLLHPLRVLGELRARVVGDLAGLRDRVHLVAELLDPGLRVADQLHVLRAEITLFLLGRLDERVDQRLPLLDLLLVAEQDLVCGSHCWTSNGLREQGRDPLLERLPLLQPPRSAVCL